MKKKRWRAIKRLRSLRGRRTGWRGGSLRWHESWIIRAAALTSFILFCGYASSLFIAKQGIESVSRIAYDPDIEQALASHLQMIKEVHELRKESVLTRLKTIIPPNYRLNLDRDVPIWELKEWLKKARVDEFANIEEAKIQRLSPKQRANFVKEGIGDLVWLDQETLKIYNHTIEFPKSMAYLDFQTAQALRQRYQLIGVTLEEEIRPTLLKFNAIIIAATFLILITAYLVLARRFKVAVERVIDGFSYWSEVNPKFRFSNRWRGELRLITAQFNAMADDVEANRKRSLYLEKIASWQTMARKLAHEIKNPLTPIQMMVAQVKRRYSGTDPDYESLLENAQNIVNEEIGGLRRMVDSFSEFARLPGPRFAQHDLAATVRNAVELQQAGFPQHSIKFQSTCETCTGRFDNDLIRQVLVNLIKNAAEASSEKPAEIIVTLQELQNQFTITVQDNGPGIPKEMQKNVFEAYFTTKHTGPSPGMGLGLAVCQKIIMDHQGEISVKSEPQNTVFTIHLPKRMRNHQNVS